MGNLRQSQGFSLVEIIVVITITAILSGLVSSFLSQPMKAYRNVDTRAKLVAEAEGALQRIARDVRRALPNSLRIAGPSNVLELLYVVDGGRYRAAGGTNAGPVDHTAASDILEFAPPAGDTSFNLLGRLAALSFTYGTPLAAGHRVAVYSTGNAIWANAAAGSNPGRITPAGTTITVQNDTDEDQLVLSAAHRFLLNSPARRTYLVDGPLTFLCDTGAGTLTRYAAYTVNAAQPTNPGAAPLNAGQSARLSSRVTGCTFTYQPGSSQRAGLVTLALTLAENQEQVQLLHQVHVDNVP